MEDGPGANGNGHRGDKKDREIPPAPNRGSPFPGGGDRPERPSRYVIVPEEKDNRSKPDTENE